MRPVRGFRFDGAGMGDRVGMGDGLQISPTGRVTMVEGNDAIRQAILLLLTTDPGERVMRPDYGCLVRRLIFSPNDATTAGLAIHYVRKAISRWERRVNIVHLDAGPDPLDHAVLQVSLEYRVRATGADQAIAFSVQLDGQTN